MRGARFRNLLLHLQTRLLEFRKKGVQRLKHYNSRKPQQSPRELRGTEKVCNALEAVDATESETE